MSLELANYFRQTRYFSDNEQQRSDTGHSAMRLRGRLKYLLYSASGSFPYFGHTVHFPPHSHIFVRACAEGIYEQQTATLLMALVQPSTTFMDIGANIGLLSIPVLVQSAAHTVSVEASPDTFRYLKQTWARSPHRDRWRVIGSAVGRVAGEAKFWASSPANGAFDGLSDTGRGGPKQAITVTVQTLDQIWNSLDSPRVSVVKIDVEGGERDVIAGGQEMIAHERPALVIEWSRRNLPAYGVHPRELLTICHDIGYRTFAYPNLCLIDGQTLLDAAMAQTETFLLVSR